MICGEQPQQQQRRKFKLTRRISLLSATNFDYRRRHKITHPLDRFSTHSDYATSKVFMFPKPNDTFSDSSLRDISNAALFRTGILLAGEHLSLHNRYRERAILWRLWKTRHHARLLRAISQHAGAAKSAVRA